MARLFRPIYTKPLPANAERFTRRGKPWARWPLKSRKKKTDDDNPKFKEAELTEDGRRVRLRSAKWYGEYADGNGLQTVPLSTNKEVAEQMLAELIRKAGMESVGIRDPFEAHRKRPLAEHLDEFKQALEARNNSAKYVRQTYQRVKAVLDGCRFVFQADVQASRLAAWLADERQADRLTITTGNYYLRDCKSFFTWLVKDRRAPQNPLEYLPYLNDATEEHRERRTLPAWEFEAIMVAARTGKTVRKLPGLERFMLYLVAGETGFRAQELASLTPESFHLDVDAPTATVAASYSKHKREDVQPIRVELAEVLRPWLAKKVPGERLWPGAWYNHAAKMVRADLEAARRTWIEAAGNDAEERQRREEADCLVFADAAGCVFDFHAIRGQFVSNLLETAGVSPKMLQKLARHADIKTTLKHYARVQLADAQAALDRLPPLPTGGGEPGTLQATGTDNFSVRGASPTASRREMTSISGRKRELSADCKSASPGSNPGGASSISIRSHLFAIARNCLQTRLFLTRRRAVAIHRRILMR